MKGDAAVAGALRTCADTFYAVPGYPVTEIARMAGAELVINEKVALEYALGDSIAGRRSTVILKNVGLNVCADPLINATTQGLVSGVVVVAGDDILAKGSQNMQDSRYYGEIAQVPVLEPDAETCSAAVAAAFEASERFSRIAILRITPPLLDHEVPETVCIRTDGKGSLASADLTMKGRSQAAGRRFTEMVAWSRASPLNRMRGGTAGAGAAVGDSRIVTVYPPPGDEQTFRKTRELGRPFLHDHRCLSPPPTIGEPQTFTGRGHYRTFCRDCPFRMLMGMLTNRKMDVIYDMGCAVLAANPPYRIGKAGYALGSSVAVAARSTRVALSGDYALLHSGINGLIDVYEKHLPLLCIVLKNNRMGLTGGQGVYDLNRYLAWANPVICPADDESLLKTELLVRDTPRTLVVEGTCPEGCRHETVEC